MQSHYALDKTNAKLMGVCAGFANYSGIDPLGVRLLAVALTFFLLGPLALVAYVLLGWLAPQA